MQPVTAKTGPADLPANVLAAITAYRDAQAASYNPSFGYQSASVEEDYIEASALSVQWPRPLWSCLLLRWARSGAGGKHLGHVLSPGGRGEQ